MFGHFTLCMKGLIISLDLRQLLKSVPKTGFYRILLKFAENLNWNQFLVKAYLLQRSLKKTTFKTKIN